MRILSFSFEQRSLDAAIAASRSAFMLAELGLARTTTPVAVVGVSEIAPGPVVVLGALQHAGRVIADFESETPIVRRTTSGTGFHLDGGMLFTIALSAADAAFPDVSPRTLINRSVRPFLSGFSRAGLGATYLGRDWIAYRRDPLAVLALDMSPRGAVLIEAWVTGRGSLSIPRSLASPLERSCDRFRGRSSRSLTELASAPAELAGRFVEGAAERLGGMSQAVVDLPAPDISASQVTAPHSPLPDGVRSLPPIEIPIGFMDVGSGSLNTSWVGGDMLAPVYALGFEQPVSGETLPMEGAQWENVRRARELARTT